MNQEVLIKNKAYGMVAFRGQISGYINKLVKLITSPTKLDLEHV